MTGGRFSSVVAAERMAIVAAKEDYTNDTSEDKIDLIVGAYRTAEGKPWVMPFIQKVEQEITSDPNLDHEYLYFLGMEKFNKLAPQLILGEDSPALLEGRAFGCQTLSGNGALRIGTEFLVRHLNYKTVYMSDPTWDNHRLVFRYGGFSDLKYYRYWDPATRGVNFKGLMEDLRKAPKNSVIILHMCAHNPTGCDLTREQWTMVADIMEEKHLFPFIDAAYQGFASGDLEKDAWPVRYLVDRGFEFFIAQSFSKSMAIYSERVGCLTVVLGKDRAKDAINMRSHLVLIARSMYISPPRHGGQIVIRVLSDPAKIIEWKKCLKVMYDRIQDMRKALHERLVKLGTPGDWNHVLTQLGMFSFLGLTGHQVEHLKKKHHVHILSNGRANMCGITHNNVDRVAEAIHDAVTKVHK